MKHATRKKFLQCFRPVGEVDVVVLGNAKHHRRKVSSPRAPPTSIPESGRSRKRSLSRILKAVLFDSALTRSIRRRRRSGRHPSVEPTEGPPSSSSSGGLTFGNRDVTEMMPIDPNFQRTACSSSTGSFQSFSMFLPDSGPYYELSSKLEEGPDQVQRPRRIICNYMNTKFSSLGQRQRRRAVVYVFLAILGVTVLCGRISAIFFTCLWLYLIFRRVPLESTNLRRKTMLHSAAEV